MKIAICDDDEHFRVLMSEILTDNFSASNKIAISLFDSGERLLSEFNRNTFDIIFLDIQMKELNGLETAKRIRETDGSVILVFLTSFREYAISGYEYGAFRYLLKDEPAPVLLGELTAIFSEYTQRNYSFPVAVDNVVSGIPVNNIMYFEIFKRLIILHTTDKQYEFYGKLSDIEKDKRLITFVKPHKSFFVNLAYIESISTNTIKLKNGAEINLSRNYRAEVTDRFISFLAGRH